MASPDLVERLAKLLGLPIEVIQAYGKPEKHVSLKEVGTVSEVEPPYRYGTLQEQAVAPPAEQRAPSKKQESALFKKENELYAQWHDASAEERPKFERRLFRVVVTHARNVMWGKIPEADENLARDIAAVVIKQLAAFDGESKFTTWTHRIILNHCNLYLRRVIRERERFYQADENLEDPRTEAAFAKVVQAVDLELIDRLAKGLAPEDYCVWECWRDGMTMKATAEKLGIPEDSAENSLRRKVKPYLKEKILAQN
jgi:DNA-directed RNA polymerase specialized sigma24 family protein